MQHNNQATGATLACKIFTAKTAVHMCNKTQKSGRQIADRYTKRTHSRLAAMLNIDINTSTCLANIISWHHLPQHQSRELFVNRGTLRHSETNYKPENNGTWRLIQTTYSARHNRLHPSNLPFSTWHSRQRHPSSLTVT